MPWTVIVDARGAIVSQHGALNEKVSAALGDTVKRLARTEDDDATEDGGRDADPSLDRGREQRLRRREALPARVSGDRIMDPAATARERGTERHWLDTREGASGGALGAGGAARATEMGGCGGGSPGIRGGCRGEPIVNANCTRLSDSRKNRVDSYLLEYQQPASRSWTLQLRGILDRVHLPPLPGFPGSPENVDAITAASRPVQSAAASKDSYLKQRKEVTGSVAWHPAEGALRGAGSYYVSHESDFLGQQASFDLAREWNQGSTSLAARVAYGYDRITPDEHTGGDPTPQSRNTADLTLTCTQS
jgi:hypothetical protein